MKLWLIFYTVELEPPVIAAYSVETITHCIPTTIETLWSDSIAAFKLMSVDEQHENKIRIIRDSELFVVKESK